MRTQSVRTLARTLFPGVGHMEPRARLPERRPHCGHGSGWYGDDAEPGAAAITIPGPAAPRGVASSGLAVRNSWARVNLVARSLPLDVDAGSGRPAFGKRHAAVVERRADEARGGRWSRRHPARMPSAPDRHRMMRRLDGDPGADAAPTGVTGGGCTSSDSTEKRLAGASDAARTSTPMLSQWRSSECWNP